MVEGHYFGGKVVQAKFVHLLFDIAECRLQVCELLANARNRGPDVFDIGQDLSVGNALGLHISRHIAGSLGQAIGHQPELMAKRLCCETKGGQVGDVVGLFPQSIAAIFERLSGAGERRQVVCVLCVNLRNALLSIPRLF